MLTPAFDLAQDSDFLRILIKARYAKVTEVEIFVDGNDFKFYAKPYFLRLQLPGRVVEDGREKAKYDVNTGSFEINLPKETPGEAFEGLDMLTTLLAPKGQKSAEQLSIEVTGVSEVDEQSQQEHEDGQGEIDWQMEQQPFHQEEDSLLGDTTYGFANKRSGVFQRLQEELCDIVDVPNPDTTRLIERKQAREFAEKDKFDDDHYLADLYQDVSAIEELLTHKPPWHQEWRNLKAKGNLAANHDQVAYGDQAIVHLTEDEKEQMRRLPNRHHLLDAETERGALLSLVDIIFAYAYNVRTTLSENTVESAWTVCKLSPTLSWLDWFTSLDEVVAACYRRALCYPLYRHWELTNKVFQDVKRIFLLGRRRLLKCLLEVHHLLAGEDPHYILNELYVTDYCVWIQSLTHYKIASLAEALKKVKITKCKIGFELKELERAAELVTLEDSQEQIQEDEVSSVHQYGYPQILKDSLDSESALHIREDGNMTKRNEIEGDKTSDVLIKNGLLLNETVDTEQNILADECVSVQESLVDDVATKMSDLGLSGKGCKDVSPDDKQTNSVSHSESKQPLSSLETWSLTPPSRKIEVFGEDMTSHCSADTFRKGVVGTFGDEIDGSPADRTSDISDECNCSSAAKSNVEMLGQDTEPKELLHCHSDANKDQSFTRNQSADSEGNQAGCSHSDKRSSASGSDSDSDVVSELDSDNESDSNSDSESDSESDTEADLIPDLILDSK